MRRRRTAARVNLRDCAGAVRRIRTVETLGLLPPTIILSWAKGGRWLRTYGGFTIVRTVANEVLKPTDKDELERGSGNVFADLALPDAEAHLLKAQLVTRIDEIIRRRGLKQVEAAKLLGLSQPDVSRLLRGSFRDYSMERLLRLLTALGRDVNIVIRETRSERQGRLSIEA